MQKTYWPKEKEIEKRWYLVDAQGKTLGRLAARIAAILRGKHKSIYTPHLDTGDSVIVINAAKIKASGKKLEQKVYRRYSGYPGGLKEMTLDKMLGKDPETVFRLAVRRMLPQGKLGSDIFKKLKVYADNKHPHAGQRPRDLTI